MPVQFIKGWEDSHDSSRSKAEVQRIVEAVATVDQLKGSDVGQALNKNEDVGVVKGIHNDKIGAHITVQSGCETYHIYLTPKTFSNTEFIWEPAAVCTGSEALNEGIERTAYQTEDKVYKVADAHYA